MIPPSLLEAVLQAPVPIGIFDLDQLTVVAANASAYSLLGMDSSPDGAAIAPLAAGPEQVLAQLELLASGAIDGYEARVDMHHIEGGLVPLSVWVRRVPSLASIAIAVAAPFDSGSAVRSVGPQLLRVTGGLLDEGWRVVRVTANGGAPAREASALAGTSFLSLLHPADVPRLLSAAAFSTEADAGVELVIQLRRPGGWAPLRATFFPLPQGNGTTHFGFSLADARVVPSMSSSFRAVSAEELEIEMTLLMRSPQGPLTSRQSEVLAHLLAGKRVPAIAKEMFISQSTVRNHLHALFERYGVSSQGELLDLLHGRNLS